MKKQTFYAKIPLEDYNNFIKNNNLVDSILRQVVEYTIVKEDGKFLLSYDVLDCYNNVYCKCFKSYSDAYKHLIDFMKEENIKFLYNRSKHRLEVIDENLSNI